MKQTKNHSKRSFYVTAILAIASISILATAALTFVAYPTQKHRDIAAQQTEIIEKNGGAFNLDAYENEEYKKLSNTTEANYSSTVFPIGQWAQFIGSIILVGLVYKYIRRHNISPTRRAIGATTAIFMGAAIIDRVPVSYLQQLLAGEPAIEWNIAFVAGMFGSVAIVAIGTFVVAYYFERWYNKHYNFEV